jgi:hypothetical protein
VTGGWAATDTLREKIALRIAPWLYVPYREDREEAFKDLAEVAYDSREAVWMSLSRLREQRDFNIRQGAYLNDQRRAAEARCARLQQALHELIWAARYVVTMHPEHDDTVDRRSLSRLADALAGPDTPADICPECAKGVHVACLDDGSSVWTDRCKCDCGDTPADSPEPREGIVMVYDWQHRHLGCMGIERWERLLSEDAEARTDVRRAGRFPVWATAADSQEDKKT